MLASSNYLKFEVRTSKSNTFEKFDVRTLVSNSWKVRYSNSSNVRTLVSNSWKVRHSNSSNVRTQVSNSWKVRYSNSSMFEHYSFELLKSSLFELFECSNNELSNFNIEHVRKVRCSNTGFELQSSSFEQFECRTLSVWTAELQNRTLVESIANFNIERFKKLHPVPKNENILLLLVTSTMLNRIELFFHRHNRQNCPRYCVIQQWVTHTALFQFLIKPCSSIFTTNKG